MAQQALTLERFISFNQPAFPGGASALTGLLSQIGFVGKYLAYDLRRAALLDILGTTGTTNVQGETVKKFDEIANETFVRLLQQNGQVCALASEEMEQPVILPRRLVVPGVLGARLSSCLI